jgi:hypothetical protein
MKDQEIQAIWNVFRKSTKKDNDKIRKRLENMSKNIKTMDANVLHISSRIGRLQEEVKSITIYLSEVSRIIKRGRTLPKYDPIDYENVRIDKVEVEEEDK